MHAIGMQPLPLFGDGHLDGHHFVLDGRCVEFPDGLQTAMYTHTLHRFPGKFVPQVARELLSLVGATNQSLIGDPFCGSGTSLVEASVTGIPMVGVDLDPLAVLISQAKTMVFTPRQLAEVKLYWDSKIGMENPVQLENAVPNLYHWFQPDTAKQLEFIKQKALRLEDEGLRLFSLAVFSSIIRRVSNADDQTQKTYVSGTLKKAPPAPSEIFRLTIDRAARGMASYAISRKATVTVQRGDARRWRSHKKLDGIITSPPYIDSIDYVYNQLLEYFWLYEFLGFASVDDVRTFRAKPMGFRRTNVATALKRLSADSPLAVEILESKLAEIQKVSKKEAENVVGYFEDFEQHIKAAKRIMKPGSIYALAIGESHIRGVQLPTPKILAALFCSSGFEFVGSCSYMIKRHYMKFPRRSNSGKINLDYIYCFRKP